MQHKTLNILIIDDDVGDAKQLAYVLKKAELTFTCSTANTVAEALKLCAQATFDCIFVDYQMPGQNGLDSISTLRNQFPASAVIMLTGRGDEMVATEAMKRGATDYIVKENLTPTLLKNSILHAVEKIFLEEKTREKEFKIEYIAYHDYLTNIPNRRLFHHDVSKALKHAKRNKKILAVLLLDLDGFKNINDTLGHDTGDELLKLVTERFLSVLREEDTIARLGGDEFGVLISDLNNEDNAAIVAKNLILSLEKSFEINHKKINITPSIGIAIDHFGTSTIPSLLHNADKAMYVAKKQGGNNFQFYDSKCDT